MISFRQRLRRTRLFENDEDINAFREYGKLKWHGNFFTETDDPVADDKAAMDEDGVPPPTHEAHLRAGSDQQADSADKFGSDSLDDDVKMGNWEDEADDNLTAIIEEAAIEMTGDGNPLDPEKKIELEYDSDEDEFDFIAMDGHAEDNDDLIAGPSEASPVFEDDDDGNDILEDIEFELNEDEEIIASSDSLKEPPEMIEFQQEKMPEFDHDGNLTDLADESLSMFDDSAVTKSENDIIALADFDDDDAEIEEDIIEITEFDHHFPEEDDEILEYASTLDPSGLRDEDFLELFEIGEENPTKDAEMRELSESEEKAVEAELSRLFDDTLEDEALFENNAPKPVDESSASNPGWILTASALSSGTEKPDHPDRFFPNNSGNELRSAQLSKDQPEEDERLMANLHGLNKSGFQSITPAQIDIAIERVINEKFADRIEQIIYEIIEKAVSKEIIRLKSALLEDSSIDDGI